jgi:hypothetical protein
MCFLSIKIPLPNFYPTRKFFDLLRVREAEGGRNDGRKRGIAREKEKKVRKGAGNPSCVMFSL